jgi:hypothetical protein
VPDFLSFDQYFEANKDSESQALEEALARAEAADAEAQGQLRKAGAQASGGFNPRRDEAGVLQAGEGDITRVASYTDYLTAKRNAQAAWQAVGQGNAAQRALLGQREMTGRAGEAATARNARETRAAAQAQQANAGLRALSAQEQAAAQAKRAAEERRSNQFRDAAKGFYGQVESKWAQQNAFIPFGPANAGSDAQRSAQMLAYGAAQGDYEPETDFQRQGIYSQAWGTPRNTKTVDEYGRPKR